MKLIHQFLQDTRAASAVEYGLLAALIALVAVAGMSLVGTDLTQLMNTLGGCLFDKTSCPGYSG